MPGCFPKKVLAIFFCSTSKELEKIVMKDWVTWMSCSTTKKFQKWKNNTLKIFTIKGDFLTINRYLKYGNNFMLKYIMCFILVFTFSFSYF